jgi:hypothetical protein
MSNIIKNSSSKYHSKWQQELISGLADTGSPSKEDQPHESDSAKFVKRLSCPG